LPPRFSAFQHCRDVADPAATHLGVAERVVDDPLIDRARLLELGRRAGGDPVGGRFDDAVDGNELGPLAIGPLAIERALGGRERRGLSRRGEIRRTIARRDAARDFDHRGRFPVRPFDMQHLGCVFGIAREPGLRGVCRPGAAERSEPVRLVHRGRRYPGLCLALRLLDFEARHDLEIAPRARPDHEGAFGAPRARQARRRR
jgi:hypothetical protein